MTKRVTCQKETKIGEQVKLLGLKGLSSPSRYQNNFNHSSNHSSQLTKPAQEKQYSIYLYLYIHVKKMFAKTN